MNTTCCVTWIWDVNTQTWTELDSITSIGEIRSFDQKLTKVVDVLGRENSGDKNKPLFYIYDDGTVQKKMIIE